MRGVATNGRRPARAIIEGENFQQPSWRFSEDLPIQPTLEGQELANKLLEELAKEIAQDEKVKPSKPKKK